MSALCAGTQGGLLAETFVHMSGIGLKTERRLWHAGIGSWSALGQTAFARRPAVAQCIARSERALLTDDLAYFFGALPASERWRAYSDFGEQFAAVDIETTGLSIYDQLTVVGIELNGEYRTFVRGANLDDAAEMLSVARGLITFNGALFDLPFLARSFPGLALPAAHVDLRFLARRVGWTGSLKKVEGLANVRRGAGLRDISGFEATVLWSEFEHGDLGSLRKLVAYNAADTCVLRPLADLVVEQLRTDLENRRRPPIVEDQLPLEFEALAPAARGAARRPPRAPVVRRCPGNVLQVGSQTIALPAARAVRPSVTLEDLRARMRDPDARVVGIDLTGSDARPSGWALLQGDLVVSGMLHSFDELLANTLSVRPAIVSIDSPLSLPVGRHCTDDSCACRAVGGITRHCERELKRRGVNVYPCLIQSMQALTRRGMRLAAALRQNGVEVVESYPGAAQDIMRIPRKGASQEQLRAGLERFGVRGIRPAGQLTHDELDAITSAAVGGFYLADLYEGLGNDEEDYLIIPSLRSLTATHTPSPQSRNKVTSLMIVGTGSSGSRVAHALRGHDVHRGDWHAYWDGLATHGAGLRVAQIASADQRKPRRPVFADLSVREDHPQITRLLRRWARDWST
jgi:uncharacterized protein YprB with RNaseH-like and TPR domain/predicted nuclease with RNAse H fold